VARSKSYCRSRRSPSIAGAGRASVLIGLVAGASVGSMWPPASLVGRETGVRPDRHAPKTGPAITVHDLKARLSIVADDSMGGRQAGSPEASRAQRYIERELRRLRLIPMGDGGGFTQAIRTVLRKVGPSALTAPSGRSFALWTDFLPLPWGWAARPFAGAKVVYGGVIGDAGALEGKQVEGKFVIMHSLPGRSIFPRVSPNDPLGRAAAVAVVWLEGLGPNRARVDRIRRGLDAGLEGNANQSRAGPLSMVVSRDVAEALLGQNLDSVKIGTEGPVVQGTVAFADSTVLLCCNIVATIPGSDRALARTYVALGAHLDHIGTALEPVDHDSLRAANTLLWQLRGRSSAGTAPPNAAANIRVNADSLHRVRPARWDSIFNGADDDGSGTVALLEIAEAVMATRVRPKRSLLFVWHTAEEQGNQGSTWFTEHPTVALDSIMAQLNVDMVGRGAASDLAGGGPRYLQVIGSRHLSTELGDLIARVNRETGDRFTFDYQYDKPGDPRQLYCRSDHASYARYGIPIAFFTTGEHPDYHQVTDEAQYINYPHFAKTASFIRDVAVRLANLSHRLVLDHGKPDPQAGCRG